MTTPLAVTLRRDQTHAVEEVIHATSTSYKDSHLAIASHRKRRRITHCGLYICRQGNTASLEKIADRVGVARAASYRSRHNFAKFKAMSVQ